MHAVPVVIEPEFIQRPPKPKITRPPCDVSFGGESLMRPADARNSDGFLELVEMNKIDDRLMHESGFQNHLALGKKRNDYPLLGNSGVTAALAADIMR